MKETFAGKTRKIIQDLGAGGREFSIKEAADALDLISKAEKRPLHNTLYDMCRSGEVERVGLGRYVYRGRRRPPELQKKMWHVLRARRTVTVEDLQELTGAAKIYAKEFLQMLARHEIVARRDPGGNQPSKYVMISDPVIMPQNDDKAAKLRRLRADKKKILEAVDKLWADVMDVRMAVNSITEE